MPLSIHWPLIWMNLHLSRLMPETLASADNVLQEWPLLGKQVKYSVRLHFANMFSTNALQLGKYVHSKPHYIDKSLYLCGIMFLSKCIWCCKYSLLQRHRDCGLLIVLFALQVSGGWGHLISENRITWAQCSLCIRKASSERFSLCFFVILLLHILTCSS